ncbi:MAG: 30S ribosomal protein S2 [Armatimonadota bacterium]
MALVTMKELLEAGVHFGHQTRRWNPKMKPFIYHERNGIYIIDLHATLRLVESAYECAKNVAAEGGTVLFIGTKRQGQESIQEAAEKCGMPYVINRWLGGMLTNWQTISKRIDYMRELTEAEERGEWTRLTKKEALKLSRERDKLEHSLGGIQDMDGPPDAVFIVDTKREETAVAEAAKLELPIIAVIDTNADPEPIDYPIPGNDDAIRAIRLFANLISEAVQEGQLEYQQKLVADADSLEQAEAMAARQGIELDEKLVERMIEEQEKQLAEEEAVAEEIAEEFAGAVEDQFVEEQLIELIDEGSEEEAEEEE